MTRIQQILQSHSLRHTQSRIDILGVFLRHDSALNERDIEKLMSVACDRVTIYRTLSTFLEKGIIHKVLDDTGSMRYAVCAPECQEGQTHQHDHVHFKCVNCGRTVCLEEVLIPTVQLPKGFRVKDVNMLLEGTCPNCG